MSKEKGSLRVIMPDRLYMNQGEWPHRRNCNSYLFKGDSGKFVAIDWGGQGRTPEISENLNTIGASPTDLTAVLLTHLHPDHAGGVADIKKTFPRAEIIYQAIGDSRLVTTEQQRLPIYDYDPLPFILDETVNIGQQIKLDGVIFTALPGMGHTPFGITWEINIDGKQILVVGDNHRINTFFDSNSGSSYDLITQTSEEYLRRSNNNTIFLSGHDMPMLKERFRTESLTKNPIPIENFLKSN